MEPFNDANNRPGIFNCKFGHYFPYIAPGERQYFGPVLHALNFKYNLAEGLKGICNKYEFARLTRDFVKSFYYRITKKRAFVKDPNALFMVEWMYHHFNADIVVLIRHPAAFVSSLIVLKWYFPFKDLLKQEELIQTYLFNFRDKIKYYAKYEQKLIDQAILAWCLLHQTILHYQKKHLDWIFVRHEDLSRNPEKEFRQIFQKVGIEYDKRVASCVKKYSGTDNPSDTTSTQIPVSSKQSIKRNSQSNIWNFKNRLTTKEILYIRKRVESISGNFYKDDDW